MLLGKCVMLGSCIGNGFFLSAVVILQVSGERSGAAGLDVGTWDQWQLQ